MPAVTDVLLETTLPGHTQQRVWAHPEVQSHALLVLTFARLYAVPPNGTLGPDTLTAVETAHLPDLLGPDAIAVDLPAVCRAKLDLLTNSITLEYSAPTTPDPERLTLVFATPETADACFTKIWRRLGDGCRLLPYKRDAWALARSPLLLLAAILLTTAALALGLSVYEDTASDRAMARAAAAREADNGPPPPKPRVEAALDRLNWKFVCALGGAGAALAQMWLYRRLTSPPVSLEVARDEVLARATGV